MANPSLNHSINDRSRGRGYLWAGIALAVLGVALMFVQFGLIKRAFVPWYMPVLVTLGVLMLLVAVSRRLTVTRIVALVLIAGLAGFEWFFLTSMTSLPDYTGPARAGQKLPVFRTSLAGGSPFTEQDLEEGTHSVLVFFRGRW